MEWVFLALWVNGGIAVMPEKYSAEQCKEIQNKNAKGYVLCIPAPKLTIMKDESRVEQFKSEYGDCYMNGKALICPLDKVK